MALQEGILFGIIAMLGWGVADFFVVKALRKTSIVKTFLWSQLIGLVAFFAVFLLFFKLPEFDVNLIPWILLAGFLGFMGYLSFYKGLEIGKVSVVAPISSCWAAITVVLSLIFLNEIITQLQSFGIILAIGGAILVSFKLRDLIGIKLKNFAVGAEYAALAAVSWGVEFIFIDILVEKLGWFLPFFFIKLLGVFFLLIYVTLWKKEASFPANAFKLILAISVLEVAAFLSYGAAITTQNTSIIAPIISAAPAVTVILALIFFREKIELNQKIGIVAALTGIVLLSL